MRRLLLTVPLLLWTGLAFAQHQHNHANMKGPNGGKMQDVAGIHAELIVNDRTITIYAFGEDSKALSTKGYSGSVLIVSGGNRETVQLTPTGETALKGEAKNRLAPDAAITLVIKTDAGKSGQVKF
ncbi:hypothetical protein [Reyranella sp.]|uniref:hypothetical protein n=1 Tax=Reyranella sp. TaxID=1929291 RepID=UPI00121643F0|nr:hypothetical protein [Reyranella sp.]TAJ88889.1 MAG: hypothetical protein EPO50_07520 [Reyranella sp.]